MDDVGQKIIHFRKFLPRNYYIYQRETLKGGLKIYLCIYWKTVCKRCLCPLEDVDFFKTLVLFLFLRIERPFPWIFQTD